MGLTDTVKGWFGKAKEQGAEPAVKAVPSMEEVHEHGLELTEKTRDFAHDAMDETTARVEE